jgi:hypothetical protein
MISGFFCWLRWYFCEQYAGREHIGHRTIGSD